MATVRDLSYERCDREILETMIKMNDWKMMRGTAPEANSRSIDLQQESIHL